MSFTIAVAGKGGVGKTTLAGLFVRFLVETGKTPVLAVDADSNTNLNDVLGLELETTLGDAREEMKKGQSEGMTKDLFIEMRVNQALVEEEGFDLIAMGRPEGSGCYCAANNLLTSSLDRLADNYKYLVVDNEAGMEHISRITTSKVDALVVVSDPSKRSLTAAARIKELAEKMGIVTGKSYLVLSMVRGKTPEALIKTAESMGLTVAGVLPDDTELADCDFSGMPTSKLPKNNPVVQAGFEVFNKIMEQE